MLRRVQFAWWSLIRSRLFWAGAVVVTGIAGLYSLDPSGADAAELFRFPLQLNLSATLAALVTVAVALPTERLLRRSGWHPMTGARRLWLLVLATPLLLAMVSIGSGLFFPAFATGSQVTPGDHAVAREAQSLLQLQSCAHWITVAGAVWLGWVAYVTMTVVSRHRSGRKLVGEIRRDPRTVLISADAGSLGFSNSAASREDLFVGPVQAATGSKLSRDDIRQLYRECLVRLDLDPTTAPALVVSAHDRVNHYGPFYARSGRGRAVIVLPADLSQYLLETFEHARDHIQSKAHERERVSFSQRKWALASIATLLLHELVHHVAKEDRIDRLVDLTKALFPVPWFVALWFAGRKLADAREHTCDAVVTQRTNIEPWFVRIAVRAMHDVLNRLREARLRQVLASMRLLSAEYMSGGDATAMQRRLALLVEMPVRLRTGPAAILLLATCGLAFLFAPRPTWHTVVAFPDVLPFSRGVPHVRIQEFGSAYDFPSLEPLIQAPPADLSHIGIPDAYVQPVIVPPPPVINFEPAPVIVPRFEVPTVELPVVEVPGSPSFQIPESVDPTADGLPESTP